MKEKWLSECEAWFRRKDQVQSYGNGCEEQILAPVRDLIDAHIPSKLYKLQSPGNYAIDYLRKGLAGLTASKYFNDPFDTVQMLDKQFIREAIEREDIRALLAPNYKVWQNPDAVDEELLGFPSELKKAFVDKVQRVWTAERFAHYLKHPDEFKESLINDNIRQTQEQQQEISAQTFVSCFTTQISNMLMWSHYAKSHSGFALGFDFNDPVNVSAKEMLYPVFYSDRKIDVTVEMGFVQQMSMVGDRNYSIDKLIGIKSSLFKSPDWAYEHEWRVVKRDLENSGRYGSIPLRASEIYYGCKIEPSVYERLHQIAQSQGLREYRMEADVFSPSYDLNAIAM